MDDFRKLEFVDIKAEEIDQGSIVRQALEIHEHGSRCVRGVRDEDVLLWATVKFVDQPRINCTECEDAFLIGILHLGFVLKKPKQLADGRVCRQGHAAKLLQLSGTKSQFQFPDEGLCASVCPYDSIVQWLSGLLVPEYGGFSLICDSNCFDAVFGMALLLEGLYSAIDTFLDRRHDFEGIMLVPSISPVSLDLPAEEVSQQQTLTRAVGKFA